MKRMYFKPQIQVFQIKSMNILAGSAKGAYGTIGGAQSLRYGGVVDADSEEDIDPD